MDKESENFLIQAMEATAAAPAEEEEEELEEEPGWTLPDKANFPNMPSGIGRLAYVVATRNQRSTGTFSFAYRGGKWIEVSYWDGKRLVWVVPKDTRITVDSLDGAIKAVEEWDEYIR